MRASTVCGLLFVVGCGATAAPAAPRSSSSATPEGAPADEPEAPASQTRPETAPPEPPLETPPPETPPPAAIACTTDADCGWDDPCAPTRCVEHRPEAACGESAASPGTCACLGGHCTLLPPGTSAAAGGVVSGAPCRSFCSADPSGGTCRADDSSGLLPLGLIVAGANCECAGAGSPEATCRYEIVPVVPCRDARDCDVRFGPDGPRPVRAARRRRRDFVPCRDGEWRPLCNDGACELVGYGC